jgi:uncharacterized protein YigE (DUF2233 family)
VIKIDSLSIDNFDIEQKANVYQTKKTFSITGSVFNADCSTIGLLVSKGKEIKPINTGTGEGGFYMKPNGALLLNDKDATVCETGQISSFPKVRYGIQSGPMLVTNGVINSLFQAKSQNEFVRSGVGLSIDKKTGEKHLVFAISKRPMNYYHFANLFLTRFNCLQALNLASGNPVMSVPFESNQLEMSNCYNIIYQLKK